jgi:hypothetical protein
MQQSVAPFGDERQHPSPRIRPGNSRRCRNVLACNELRLLRLANCGLALEVLLEADNQRDDPNPQPVNLLLM